MLRRATLIAVCVFAMAAHAQAAETNAVVPTSQIQMKMSFAPLVKSAAPAVVNIYTKSRVQVQEQSPFMNDPFFQQFFGQHGMTFGGRAREQLISSLGSGVLIKPDGVIVTSLHVVKGAEQISVVLSDNREFEAKVTLKDPRADLAFLKINATEKLPFIELRNSDTLEVGELVLAIGNPFGVGQTVTNGIISALARRAEGVSDYNFFIQTDAAINPGNSGGALIGMDGKLIGINTAIYSRTGGSQGIGFAIPANMVASLLDSKASQSGQVIRPWLGLSVQPITTEIADSLGMKTPRGVLVKAIAAGSPAAAAGIQPGDVLLSLGGASINNEQDLQYRMALARIDSSSDVEIFRAGKTLTATVAFIAPPETPARDVRTLKGRQPLSGVAVANLSPALALEMEMPEINSGVVVLGFDAGIAGINLGLIRGDVILEVNGTKIPSTQTLEKIMNSKSKTWQISYLRGGNVMTLSIRLP